MTTISNERKQFDVQSESDNLVMNGSATYYENGDIRDFNGNISPKKMENSDSWSGYFNYSEENGMIISDNITGMPVTLNAEASGLMKTIVGYIRDKYISTAKANKTSK